MSREQLTIEAMPRTTGKHFSRLYRRTRQIPAVVYGPKTEPLNFAISQNDAVKYSSHGFENSIFILKSSDPKINGLKVLKKSFDIHPVSRVPIHLDFFAPDMTKVVRVQVELRFEGKPEGTKDGGLFSAVRRDVEVECLPTEIPEFIAVDVTNMMLNDSMHVSDVTVPDGIKMITSDRETICTCAIVEEEVAATPAAAATAEGAAAAPGAAGAAAPGAAGAAAPAAGAAAPAAEKKK